MIVEQRTNERAKVQRGQLTPGDTFLHGDELHLAVATEAARPGKLASVWMSTGAPQWLLVEEMVLPVKARCTWEFKE